MKNNISLFTSSLSSFFWGSSLIVASGCIPQGAGTATLSHKNSASLITSQVSGDGEEASGLFAAGSKGTQVLSAPKGSPIEGVSTSFPPGSLAISTEISVGPGANIVDAASITASLGLASDTTFDQIGASVSIQTSVDMDTAVPFTLALPLPKTNLHLTANQNWAVVYKANKVGENSVSIGIIPESAIRFIDGLAKFETSYFGTYQLVVTNRAIKKQVEAKLTALVATTPVTIDKVVPFVADAGQTVTISGKDFTGNMVMTLASLDIKKVDIRSDVSASFVVPNGVKFGYTDLVITQAEEAKSYGLLARSNDKLNYPLMTIEPAGVCQGIKYYDAQGTLRVGTKSCGSSVSSNTSVLDANNDGAADKAEDALRAGVAAFARGKDAGLVPANTILNLNGNGDFYTVTPGAAEIHNIANRPRGTKIALFFETSVLLKNSDLGLSGIHLEKSRDIEIEAGDYAEFRSLGSGHWLQTKFTEFIVPMALVNFHLSYSTANEMPIHGDYMSGMFDPLFTIINNNAAMISIGESAPTKFDGKFYFEVNSPGAAVVLTNVKLRFIVGGTGGDDQEVLEIGTMTIEDGGITEIPIPETLYIPAATGDLQMKLTFDSAGSFIKMQPAHGSYLRFKYP